MRTLVIVAAAVAVGAGAAGCIHPPAIVLVDHATRLEQQAAGSFAELEQKLMRSAIAPRPVPLTPAQLEALGIRPPPLVDSTELTDADRLDGLLKQHCVGEAKDGTLADTYDSCVVAADRAFAVTLIQRANEARVQLWRWMHDRRPEASVDELRRAWRRAHLEGCICGAWVQKDDGTWEAKKC
jgi:hypothetical protein